MEIINVQCPNCSSSMKLDSSLRRAFCIYCGTEMILEGHKTLDSSEPLSQLIENLRENSLNAVLNKQWETALQYCRQMTEADKESNLGYLAELQVMVSFSVQNDINPADIIKLAHYALKNTKYEHAEIAQQVLMHLLQITHNLIELAYKETSDLEISRKFNTGKANRIFEKKQSYDIYKAPPCRFGVSTELYDRLIGIGNIIAHSFDLSLKISDTIGLLNDNSVNMTLSIAYSQKAVKSRFCSMSEDRHAETAMRYIDILELLREKLKHRNINFNTHLFSIYKKDKTIIRGPILVRNFFQNTNLILRRLISCIPQSKADIIMQKIDKLFPPYKQKEHYNLVKTFFHLLFLFLYYLVTYWYIFLVLIILLFIIF